MRRGRSHKITGLGPHVLCKFCSVWRRLSHSRHVPVVVSTHDRHRPDGVVMLQPLLSQEKANNSKGKFGREFKWVENIWLFRKEISRRSVVFRWVKFYSLRHECVRSSIIRGTRATYIFSPKLWMSIAATRKEITHLGICNEALSLWKGQYINQSEVRPTATLSSSVFLSHKRLGVQEVGHVVHSVCFPQFQFLSRFSTNN